MSRLRDTWTLLFLIARSTAKNSNEATRPYPENTNPKLAWSNPERKKSERLNFTFSLRKMAIFSMIIEHVIP